MSFNATNDNLVLVAPRPVRIAATGFSPVLATRTNSAAFRMLSTTPTESLDRFKCADDDQDTRDGQPEQAAARMSPRPGLPSEALEEFLSILRPSSFLYPSPTSPILRRRNNGAVIPFDRQQSTRRGENSWSPQPPSPTKTANSVKTLTPDDLVSMERLDSDHDLSSITWYPFDWRTGGPNAAHSPLHSPVNRGQAHNPFGKRRSLQSIASDNSADVDTHLGSSSSPSPVSTRITLPVEFPALHPSVSPPASLVSLSPRAIPLPSPSPDEVAESNSVN